jgi:His/Glu/Gln/Arg/opine family amino acid ABC transporter permease subunit
VLKLLWSKIYYTFIFDKRYLFFLDGLKVTLQLTFASFLLGTLTGILLCAASRSRFKWLRKLAAFFVTIFTEIPTMMLLMIFVYIIFVIINAFVTNNIAFVTNVMFLEAASTFF